MPNSSFKPSAFIKIPANMSEIVRLDHNLPRIALGNIYPAEETKGHYTLGKEFKFKLGRGYYIIPASYVEMPTEKEIQRLRWFATRPLDIAGHHRTKLFA